MRHKRHRLSVLVLALYGTTCCLLCIASLLPGPADPVAIVGGEATLPCNFSMPSPDDTVFLIFWYRGHSKSPFYTVDARFSPLLKARHFSRGVLENRFHFNLSSQPPALRIQRIEENDEGEYRCRVDYRWARTHTVVVRLRVIVPATNIMIVDEHGEQASGDIGPYNEGDDLKLVCRALGGRPPPSVTWRRQGEVIDSSYSVLDNGTSENELVIRTLHRSDLFAKLSCSANNNNHTKSLMTSVVIDLNMKPLDVHISSSSRPFTAGEKAEIVCEATGARPPARIVWIKDNQELVSVAESWARGNVTSSKLIIKPEREDDGNHLSCRADNPSIPSSAKQAAVLLRVYYKPIVSVIILKSKFKEEINEDTNVELVCNITAHPWILDVSWYFEGNTLRPNPKAGIMLKNFSLILHNVTRQQSGSYQCSATNIVGKETSLPVKLSVMFSPVCREGQKIVYGVAKGKAAKVICEVDADPSDVTFFWLFNNTYHKKHISTFLTHNLRSVATYKTKTLEDFGSLYCYAKNSVGVQKEPCVFSLVPAGPPEPVRNCAFRNITVDSVSIDCEPGRGEGESEAFVLEVHNRLQGRLEANLSTPSAPHFVVDGLPSATELEFVIFARNALGRSEDVRLEIKTKPKPVTRTGSGLTPFGPALEITVGCVCVLLFLACAGILILRKIMADSKKAKQEEGEKEVVEAEVHVDPPAERQPPGDCLPKGMPGPDVIPLALEWNGFPGETSQWSVYNGYQTQGDEATCMDITFHNTLGPRRKPIITEAVPEFRLKSTLV